jgi:hypothetical protein
MFAGSAASVVTAHAEPARLAAVSDIARTAAGATAAALSTRMRAIAPGAGSFTASAVPAVVTAAPSSGASGRVLRVPDAPASIGAQWSRLLIAGATALAPAARPGAQSSAPDVAPGGVVARRGPVPTAVAPLAPHEGAASSVASRAVQIAAARVQALAHARLSIPRTVPRVHGAAPGAASWPARVERAMRPVVPVARRNVTVAAAEAGAAAVSAPLPVATERALASAPAAARRRRFLRALDVNAPARPAVQRFPARLAPLVNAIAGRRAVFVRSDPTTRRALATVGTRAATIGNVVHLPDAPERTAPEVIAHELAHAMRPSPIPRFFADARDEEEQRADTLARAVTAPRAAPARGTRHSMGTAGLPVAAGGAIAAPAPAQSQRRPSPAPAATLETTGTLVQRSAALFAAAGRANEDEPPGATRRAAIDTRVVTERRVQRAPSTTDAPAEAPAAEQDTSLVQDTREKGKSSLTDIDIERIVTALERRVIEDLERRGRRHRPGVF